MSFRVTISSICSICLTLLIPANRVDRWISNPLPLLSSQRLIHTHGRYLDMYLLLYLLGPPGHICYSCEFTVIHATCSVVSVLLLPHCWPPAIFLLPPLYCVLHSYHSECVLLLFVSLLNVGELFRKSACCHHHHKTCHYPELTDFFLSLIFPRILWFQCFKLFTDRHWCACPPWSTWTTCTGIFNSALSLMAVSLQSSTELAFLPAGIPDVSFPFLPSYPPNPTQTSGSSLTSPSSVRFSLACYSSQFPQLLFFMWLVNLQ